ncbi:MAG: 6-phosphogluconolactonase/glucosamine-6- phosphate isomerase/deaminase [Candidatus Atelocyanobacterium thalassa isolate SIO64986]|uniref:6-phosphogluconolactonase/glucosamine-6-phosphate isomerase/deaminase n=1 Tax=Candidatus Atelocyanobacterium thalassa isolate SIO64986 TaxID=1527444 RepID=A0A086CIH6_9CHRO|nr:MAG: 6-phosphogluconolactonase/glucosamine-6- phosphate isomerase/deaminase [Candidatus Atelocyanobacterium thalassa isolate SIO64986]
MSFFSYIKYSMKTNQILAMNSLTVQIHEDKYAVSAEAAKITQNYLTEILHKRNEVTILLATGDSQIKFLEILTNIKEIDWSRINFLHLDEYLDIDKKHPASFRTYLHEKVEKHIQAKSFQYLFGDSLEPLQECNRYSKLLKKRQIDICFLGIGANGHLAFNEPQIENFNDFDLVKIVELNIKTRSSQVYQKHFESIDKVPKYALTVTIPMILSAKKILCLALGENKAKIVKVMLRENISSKCPSSFLREHPNAVLLLDKYSASLL